MPTEGRPIEERRRQVMGEAAGGVRKRTPMVRWPVLIGALLLVGAFGFLGFNAFKSASMYYLTPTELLAKGEEAYDDEVRLNGTVVDGTIERDGADVLHFTVTDDEGTMIPVVYGGVVPDTFQVDADVVVEGELTRDGVFEANHLLAKCPSKYEPESEE